MPSEGNGSESGGRVLAYKYWFNRLSRQTFGNETFKIFFTGIYEIRGVWSKESNKVAGQRKSSRLNLFLKYNPKILY